MTTFVYQCPLRWSDLDSYGHINNVQYLRLLEETRVALFFGEARRAGIDSFEGQLVVVRHEIDYRRPMFFRAEPVTVECWVTRVSVSNFHLAYEVRDEGQHREKSYATAVSVLAAYDHEGGRPRRLSVAEQDWLRTYLPAGV